MLKVTKTALVVSALTLGSMSVANAAYLMKPSFGPVQTFTLEKDVNTIGMLANYGAIYNVALDVDQSTVDAINSRTFAESKTNGIWLAPTYSKSSRSYSPAREKDFDVDVSLTGLNIGLELGHEKGWACGAIFNFGKAETDGSGNASNVENNADYFSFGAYGKMAFDNLKVTGDMVLSVVSNEFEGNTPSGKNVKQVKSDVDTNVFSMGVTGIYTFNTSFADITPHLALRYTSIELDETPYYVNASNVISGYFARNSIKTVDIFSVPFGVTVSKSIQAGDWNLAPKFDVTFTSNFGDDEMEYENVGYTRTGATAVWTNKLEFLDNFTYGATLGLDAKYKDCLDLGVGVGYTGSSNSDKFNVTANIGYRF